MLFIEHFFGQKFEKSMRAFSTNKFQFSCVYLQKDVTKGTSRLNNQYYSRAKEQWIRVSEDTNFQWAKKLHKTKTVFHGKVAFQKS